MISPRPFVWSTLVLVFGVVSGVQAQIGAIGGVTTTRPNALPSLFTNGTWAIFNGWSLESIVIEYKYYNHNAQGQPLVGTTTTTATTVNATFSQPFGSEFPATATHYALKITMNMFIVQAGNRTDRAEDFFFPAAGQRFAVPPPPPPGGGTGG